MILKLKTKKMSCKCFVLELWLVEDFTYVSVLKIKKKLNMKFLKFKLRGNVTMYPYPISLEIYNKNGHRPVSLVIVKKIV